MSQDDETLEPQTPFPMSYTRNRIPMITLDAAIAGQSSKGFKAGERREYPKADIQEMLILASGVVPSSTQPGSTELQSGWQESTESCRSRTGLCTGTIDPFKTFAEMIYHFTITAQ